MERNSEIFGSKVADFTLEDTKETTPCVATLVKVIDIIGEIIFDQTKREDGLFNLTLHTVNYCNSISFLGHCIWDSENDEREYREETNDYQPIHEYLMLEINHIFTMIKRINLKEAEELIAKKQELEDHEELN